MRRMFEERRTYKQLKSERDAHKSPKRTHQKIAVFGPSHSGKSRLVQNLLGNPKIQTSETIGASYHKDESRAHTILEFWDIGGAKRFGYLWPMYLRNAQQIILTFDSSDAESFAQLDDYYAEIEKYAPKAKIVLVGINLHPEETPEVSSDMIQTFQKKHPIFSYLSMEGEEELNVSELHEHLIKHAQPKDHKEINAVVEAKELANDSIQSLRALAEDNKEYSEVILFICKTLEGALLSDNMNYYMAYNKDLLQEYLENLRYAPSSLYSTVCNTIITVLVCFSIIATAFIALHWINAILKENYAKKGDHFLFSTLGAKQQAQEAQHKTQDVLRHKK